MVTCVSCMSQACAYTVVSSTAVGIILFPLNDEHNYSSNDFISPVPVKVILYDKFDNCMILC